MKLHSLTTATAMILFISFLQSQEKLPDVDIFTLEGTRISSEKIQNDSVPMIMVFWKTYDDNCCKELMDLNDIYIEELKDKGVRIVAVCVDNIGNLDYIRPFVYGHDIEFEVYIDKNENFKRAMSIPAVPFTILFDKDAHPFCKFLGYCPAIDEMVCKKVDESLALAEE
jgi:peroxiredoxin